MTTFLFKAKSGGMDLRCSKCKAKKVATDFYADKRRKSGLQSNCKSCFIERTSKYSKSEMGRATAKKYRLKWVSKVKERYKKWQQSPMGKITLKKYRKSERNQAYRRKYENEYSKRELPKAKDRVFVARRRANRISTSDGTVTFKRLEQLLKKQNYECNLCHKSFRQIKRHLDHIVPLSKGGTHTIKNVQWLCYVCNISKSNKV